VSDGRRETASFRSLGTLRVLNVIAVGFSLAGTTGAILGRLFSKGEVGVACALSTLVFGLAWAALLRNRKTVGATKLRWGWVASVPLAAANAGTALGMLGVTSTSNAVEGFLRGAALGGTIGAIVWVPALVATLVCFGYPISWAQKRAQQGLAGEERGELVVGILSGTVALLGLALTTVLLLSPFEPSYEGAVRDPLGPWLVIAALGFVGAASGFLAATFAKRRELVRRLFVRKVEEGAVTGYRIAESAEGKVLMRVTSMGQGYRVANFEEPLCDLDEAGEARKPLALTARL